MLDKVVVGLVGAVGSFCIWFVGVLLAIISGAGVLGYIQATDRFNRSRGSFFDLSSWTSSINNPYQGMNLRGADDIAIAVAVIIVLAVFVRTIRSSGFSVAVAENLQSWSAGVFLSALAFGVMAFFDENTSKSLPIICFVVGAVLKGGAKGLITLQLAKYEKSAD